jgi:hypothetical protein
MSVSIYAKCPSCGRFTMGGEERKFGGDREVRFYACFMCGYQDNSLYRWHDLRSSDPEYSYKAYTPPGDQEQSNKGCPLSLLLYTVVTVSILIPLITLVRRFR